MMDPIERIEEKMSSIHNEYSERLYRMEALLKTVIKHFDEHDHKVTSSSSDAKEKRKRTWTLEAALSVKAQPDT